MAWTTYSIPAATVKGIAYRDLYDAETNGVDTSRLTTDVVSAAKRRVEQRLRVDFAQDVENVGGMAAFMEDVDSVAELDADLAEAVCYAALIVYYQQEGIQRDGLFMDRMEFAQGEFERVIGALKQAMRVSAALDTALDASAAAAGTVSDIDLKSPVYIV